jgi:hypothetical protein
MPTEEELNKVKEYCYLSELTSNEVAESIHAIPFIDQEFGTLKI